VLGDDAISSQTCQRLTANFKNGVFDIEQAEGVLMNKLGNHSMLIPFLQPDQLQRSWTLLSKPSGDI